jgi:hypothetical protein
VSSSASARTVKCHNWFSQRLSALDTAKAQGTDAWILTKLSSASSGHTSNTKQNVTSYLCVDSGASRDLIPDRRYFIDYRTSLMLVIGML